MKRAGSFVVSLVLAIVASLAIAGRADAGPVEDADKSVDEVMKDERFVFCKKPRKPLFNEQQDLCPLADEPGCEGFAEACKSPFAEQPKKESSSSFLRALAPLLQILLYILVIAIVVAIAIPIVNALLKARRNKKLADKAEPATKAVAAPVIPPPPELEEITDAEAALRMAEELRRRGEYARALGLYLAAALTALDRRGAIRIAKHRTNGEYVRFCTDDASKPPLREIVREVDKVQFGKIDPTEEAVARVAQRAVALVRHTATTALTVLAVLAFTSGCNGPGMKRPYDDPAGDELPLAVLEKHGFDVAPLGRSIASVPTEVEKGAPGAKDDGKPEIIVIDVDRVPLVEDETQAHLMRYIEEGGVLVLFGRPAGWPKDLGAKSGGSTSRELAYQDYDVVLDWTTGRKEKWQRTHTISGRVAQRTTVDWNDATAIGWLGKDAEKDAYVVRKLVGKGVVYGIASDDIFTNVGILPKHNAAVLLSIMKLAATDARILRPQSDSDDKSAQTSDEKEPSGTGTGRSQDDEPETDGDDDQHGTRAKSAPKSAPPGEEGKGVKVRHAQREDAIPPPSSPFAALIAAGLGKGTWHALAATLLLFLAYGIRQARPRDRAPQTRRAFAEHVEATGAFWGRAKALPHALASYGKFVEMRLRERIPRGADPVSFLATRAKVDPETAARVWKRATEAKDDDPVRGDELETIKELRLMLVKAMESS